MFLIINFNMYMRNRQLYIELNFFNLLDKRKINNCPDNVSSTIIIKCYFTIIREDAVFPSFVRFWSWKKVMENLSNAEMIQGSSKIPLGW